jgi:preprotein translocase subunit SecD
MTDSTVEAAPEPLPTDWPTRTGDAQFRGSACESAYGKDGARQYADPGDDVLPIVGTMTTNAGSAFRAVRRTPFLTRRDVERAELVADKDNPSTFEVQLTLTQEGATKAQEFTKSNTGKCVALVAGGMVIWSASLDTPVEGDAFVLSGSFSGNRGIAIVDLFRGR